MRHQRGLTVRAVVEGGEVIAPLADRILGRSAAVDVLDPLSGEVIVAAGDLIAEDEVEKIDRAGIEVVLHPLGADLRDPMSVSAASAMAAIWRAARVVNIGEAVGVIAAQSIGEPGTQLTMRTFHIGGAVQRGAEQSSVEAAFDAKVRIENRTVVINSDRHADRDEPQLRARSARRSGSREGAPSPALRREDPGR